FSATRVARLGETTLRQEQYYRGLINPSPAGRRRHRRAALRYGERAAPAFRAASFPSPLFDLHHAP
ncbi:hypothetical protein, partial [Burkholderia dolosa]|uniref:hypothetical protein n=1 Tax=Burkholderia dolosa TaxID=152500 RepID=UPI001C963F90